MSNHKIEIEWEEFEFVDGLPEDEIRLVVSAWEARQNAYAPYSSHFHVGAAILTKDGQIIKGSNQENANYKVSCAERVALDTAGAAGYKTRIKKIAVVGAPSSMDITQKPQTPEEPVTPCGQCRQDIKEVEDLSGEPIIIIMASRNKIRRIVGIENLLPLPFGPSNLGMTFK